MASHLPRWLTADLLLASDSGRTPAVKNFTMPPPRLFLVAPASLTLQLQACLKAACEVGDVASLLIPNSVTNELIALAQSKGVAVISAGEPRGGCDGIHVDAATRSVSGARKSVGNEATVGAYCGASRHLAMEAGEAGADYVALSQNGPALGGESIVKWWSEVFEIPCVAFEPVELTDLDTLLPQNPDFIRPSDAMWDGSDAARRVVTELMQRLKQT